jgi:hypothetical protein
MVKLKTRMIPGMLCELSPRTLLQLELVQRNGMVLLGTNSFMTRLHQFQPTPITALEIVTIMQKSYEHHLTTLLTITKTITGIVQN